MLGCQQMKAVGKGGNPSIKDQESMWATIC